MRPAKIHFRLLIFISMITVSSVYPQLPGGTYSVGGGMTLYSYLQTNVYTSGISGNVILELPNGYNEQEFVRILPYPGNNQYTLTIRPISGATSCTLRDNGTNNSALSFEGANRVIIDGRPGGLGTTNVLNIIQTQKYYQNAIRFGWSSSSTDTSFNITVRNCNLKSDGSTVVQFYRAVNVVIDHCDISTYTINEQSNGQVLYGIDMGNASRLTIRNNYIHNLRARNLLRIAGIYGYGTDLGLGSSLIHNNFISLGQAPEDSLSWIHGIFSRWYAQDQLRILHNTIYIDGYQAPNSYTMDSYGIWQDQTGNVEIKKNIIVNRRSGNYRHFAIYVSATTGTFDFDDNNYDVNTETNGYIGNWGGLYASSLQNWRGYSGQDANTTDKHVWCVNPGFCDLHLSGPSFVDTDLQTSYMYPVTTDIDGESRPTTTFKGADEPSATIMVISPNGEEHFEPGQNMNITWYALNPSGSVKIELLKHDTLDRTIISSTLSDGEYTWSIPTDVAPGEDYKIRITTLPFGIVDQSDLNFTIKDITPPAAPSNLTAGGASPSPWQISGYFELNWTNPSDISGLTQAKYKIAAAPTGNLDFDGTLVATPPQSFYIGGDYTPGEYTLYLWLVDGSGNENFNNYATVVLRLDFAISNPTNFQESHGVQNDVWTKTTNQPNFTWTAPYDHSGINHYNIYFGPDENSETPSFSVTTTSCSTTASEGISYLRVQPVDNAGCIGQWETNFIFKLDQTAPTNPTTATETHSAPDNIWQKTVSDPQFTWSGASDALSGVSQYYYYWGTNATGSTTTVTSTTGCNPSVSINGTYYLRVSTTDIAGNRSQDVTLFTFRHDGTPPENPTTFTDVTGVSQNDVWQNTGAIPQLQWNTGTDPLSGVKEYDVYWGHDSLGVNSTSPQTNRTYTPAFIDTGISYLRISTIDNLDNVAPWITGFTYKFDSLAPQTIAGSPDTSNQLHFTVHWDNATDRGGSGISGTFDVRYKDGEGGSWTVFKPGISATSATFPATGEAVHGHTYYFEARATDIAGNIEDWTSVAECSTVVDTLVADEQAPAAPIGLIANSSSPSPWQSDPSFTLTWTHPSDRSGITRVYYKLETAPESSNDTTGSVTTTEPAIMVTTTKENGQLVYIWLGDGAGNSDYNQHASVNLRLDQTPPTGTIAGSPDTSATVKFMVSWSGASDTPGSGVSDRYDVRYKTDATAWTNWLQDTSFTSATFEGEDGTMYYFRALAYDNVGNKELFNENGVCSTFIDLSLADTKAPSAPTNLTAGGKVTESDWQASSLFELNWQTPSDPSGIAKTFYKLGNTPTDNADTTGSFISGPPVNVEAEIENGQDVHIWMQDGAGNVNYLNHTGVTLRWDKTPPSGTKASSPASSKSEKFTVSWSGGTDGQGSGLSGRYALQVKTGTGNWVLHDDNIQGTGILFNGEHGKTYAFEAAAYDNLDLFEAFSNVAECSTIVDTNLVDSEPPGAPVQITAGGQADRSPWQNNSIFVINWTNPDDASGIERMLYKLNDAPVSNYDTTASSRTGPPCNITADTEYDQDVYLWLEDKSGNIDYNNHAGVTMRWDKTPPTGTTPTSPATTTSTNFQVAWSNSSDGEGSGLTGFYDIMVKTGAGAWDTWEADYFGMNATYTGGGGITYSFKVLAHDSAGNVENAETATETTTLVEAPDETAPLAPLSLSVSPAGWTNQNSFTISWTNPENDANIAGAYYKIGSAPMSDEDGVYSEGSKTSISNISAGNAGHHDVYIWLKDMAGNYDHNNQEHATIYFDNVLPEIGHTPVTSANVETDVPITAQIVNHDGFSNIESFMLYYRKTGDVTAPNSQDLSSGSAIIPGSANTQRGLEYRITVEDEAGNRQWFPVSGYQPVQAEFSNSYPRAANGKDGLPHHQGSKATDYRIFSIPIELVNKRPVDIFEDDLDQYDDKVWKLFDVSGNDLVDYNTIKNNNIVNPGKAFLLIVNRPNVVIDVGQGKSPKPANYVTLPLASGWNLIGNPFDFDIPRDSLKVDGATPQTWYMGPSGWTNTQDYLKKWEGLAIRNTGNATQLRIGAGGGTAAPFISPAVADPDEYRIRISAEGEQSYDLDNYIGIYTENNVPVHTIWHEPPRLPEAVGLRIKDDRQDVLEKSTTGPALLSTWLQLRGEEGNTWDLSLQGDKAGEPVRLDFQVHGEIPVDYETKLIDLDLKLVYDLEKLEWHHQCTMSSKGNRNFRILVGSTTYINEILTDLDLIPEGFELKQNFPNPFNLTTSMIFGLPVAAKVQLDVYTILGEKVRTLVNGEEFDSGYHLIVWDGRNDAHTTVASGVYVFRWSAGKEVKIRKGILVK